MENLKFLITVDVTIPALIVFSQIPKNIKLFVPNALFLYPLKTSENRKVLWCFQGVQKGYIGNKWVNRKKERTIIKVSY